jgi:protein FRA10AC1
MSDEFNRSLRSKVLSLDAYSRHKKFINDYKMFFKSNQEIIGPKLELIKESNIARENCKFIMDEEDEDEGNTSSSWEKRLAKKYYDKLYKEYCLAELKYYKAGKVALRFRTEEEVFRGKGQFICGSLKCDSTSDLSSWEVHFAYVEDGVKKDALVKVRLCVDCSLKLNYKKKKRRASGAQANINELELLSTGESKKIKTEHDEGEATTSSIEDDYWKSDATNKSLNEQDEMDTFFKDLFQ